MSAQSVQPGDRIAYLGNDEVELGTVAAMYPELDDGARQAFTAIWDDGFNDEGFWYTTDSNIRRVKQVR